MRQSDGHDEQPGQAPGADALTMRLQLLGGFRIVIGSDMVADHVWRLRKARSMVKLLALAPGHTLHRDAVIDLLWPDLEPAAAANNLRQALHAARRALARSDTPAPPALQLQDEQVRLVPSVGLWIDVEAFEVAAAAARRSADPIAYQVALALYGGDLLPEDRYEDWAASRREALRQTYLSLLSEVADIYSARQDYPMAIAALEGAVAHDPVQEEGHAALMRLYALTGQRSRALQQYAQLRTILRHELDAEPDVVSQQLYQTILARQLPSPGSRATHSAQLKPVNPSAGPRPGPPVPLTSFVGRKREQAELVQLLTPAPAGTGVAARLVTLTGTGGCGKSRLALAVATTLVDHYADGVWLVELAALMDPALVPGAVTAILGLREAPTRSPIAALVEALRAKSLLIVLDNCEHLAEACARTVATLLGACPRVRILTTSRTALRVPGEVVWRVPSLALLDPGQPALVEHLQDVAAIHLFVERAQLVQPTFALTPGTAAAVAKICRRLDGLPLAIELAAARTAVLTVHQLAALLNEALRLLTGGARTALPRQQTLQATLDWSYELLNQQQQQLFQRLAVFAGGWTLEAAEAICADEELVQDAVLPLLAELADQSLVHVEVYAEAGRYRLLETVRQYAADRLASSGETVISRSRHAAYFARLSAEAEDSWYGPRQGFWLNRLDRDHDNLRVALGWLLEIGDVDTALRLTGGLWWFWYLRGYYREGRDQLLAVLAQAEMDGNNLPARARALLGASAMLWRLGEYAEARTRGEESVSLHRMVGNRRGLAWALVFLSHICGAQNDIAGSSCIVEALSLFREVGDIVGLARTLNAMAESAHFMGDYARAATLYEECLALDRSAGNAEGIALRLHNLGYVALHDGALPEALTRFRESLALHRAQGDRLGLAVCLEGLAAIAGVSGYLEQAARLYAAAEALREVIAAPRDADPTDLAEYERYIPLVHAGLDERTLAAVWTEGRALPLEEALDEAGGVALGADIATIPPPIAGPTLVQLDEHEGPVAQWLAQGRTDFQIAAELGLAEVVVHAHVCALIDRYGLASRGQLVVWAMQQVLLAVDPANAHEPTLPGHP